MAVVVGTMGTLRHQLGYGPQKKLSKIYSTKPLKLELNSSEDISV